MPGASPSQFGLVPAYVQYGTIIDVDASRWTVTVRTDASERQFFSCPISSEYLHSSEGEGFHHMPEIGARVLVCIPSEKDTRPVILTYVPFTDEAGTASSRRPLLNPGDMVMMTRDLNGVSVRRGGVVEIQSTEIARTLYLPRTNEIRSICENWAIFTFGGSMEWSSCRPEESPDGKKITQLDIKAKEFADDRAHVAEIAAGGATPDGAMHLKVYADGDVNESALQRAVSLVLRKNATVLAEHGDWDHALDAGASVSVYNTKANVEGALLGLTYLTDTQKFHSELQTALAGLGIILPGLATLIAKEIVSISTPPGTAPYLSTRLKLE